ncbi:glycosyltransferase family 2 protein [Brachybacterium sp. UNK5269]|uniref:glycosyltransferase family 2 protein n=1 Tax=Brachybacterium sp. UNK5269 TaxID=3408576 RepID=UPI003BAF1164
MSARHVTAVVLLSGSTGAPSQRATLAAVGDQTRSADHVLAVVPSDLPEENRAALAAAVAAGTVHETLPVSASLGRAGAVQETLELLSRRAQDPAAGEDADPERTPTPDTGPADPAQPRRRRVRQVDVDAVERERTQHAEDLARVPQRLRRAGPRPGRRVGATAGAEDGPWLWFVVDGAIPGRDALARQLEMLETSPHTAVVGAKRVRRAAPTAGEQEPPLRPEDADALVDVGLALTHGGRVVTGVEPGEIDQGQADWRQDVLAVPLPGMLIREQTLREVGGLDPDLPAPWAEIDLCRRIWRAGERVAVQATARVLHPAPTRDRLERLREQRTGQILVLLKHRRPSHALLTLLLLPLLTLLRMLGAIAAAAPRSALMELRAAAAALPRVRRVLGRGRRDRRRAQVPRGRLAPLYVPRGEGMRRWIEDVWNGLAADDDRQRRIRRTTWGIAGTRHGVDDADYGRHILWTVVVALFAAVLGLSALRGLFGRGELVGPGLRPVPESWTARWEAAWASWIPGGLGERGPGDALVRLLGHLPFGGSLLVEILVFAAVPASALCAWWAAGAITRAVGARLVIATVWALAPPLLGALSSGAWPLLLVHALLPLLALAVGRAVGLPHKVSQASVPAAAAGGLLLLVIGAVQPALVVLVAIALALVAIAAPGRRLRLLWVLVPSLALHAPYLPVLLAHPETLLAVAGVPPGPGSATPADLLGLWPVATGLPELLAPHVGATAALLLPLLPVAPVVLAALASPLLAGAAGRAGRFSVLMAALGLLAVLLSRSTWTAVADGQPASPPLHALLSLTLLALAVGAAASFDALARREPGDTRSRRVVTGAIGTVVAAACLVTVVGGSLLLPGLLRLDRVEGGGVPAAAADQGRTEARARVLVLAQQEDGAVLARLVVHGGDSVIQHAVVADARDLDAVAAGEPLDGDAASGALREAVAGMLSAGAGADEQSAAPLAIAYVVVPGDPAEQSELLRMLDASGMLEKVTEGSRGGMWRVIEAAPRAVVTGGTAPVPLPSGIIDAGGAIPGAEAERTVVLSERFDTQWRATLDGTELEPLRIDGWAQGFTVPAGAGGEVAIHRDQPLRLLWQLLLYAATELTALIALPWRVRPRAAEEMYG